MPLLTLHSRYDARPTSRLFAQCLFFVGKSSKYSRCDVFVTRHFQREESSMPPWMLKIEAAVVDMSAGIREFTRRAVRLVFMWREGRGKRDGARCQA